ncbi:delta-class carbonic anhydrase [uncultured Roseobacter sp.]|uniref:delta-class carbonic anhydrase n=1 Tax=uncultured Roseobacter sp. TaxID=114847 RepID=UPI0026270594|nr:delta-class carbonic anhydrase [uncultured Roseobacter sp.]
MTVSKRAATTLGCAITLCAGLAQADGHSVGDDVIASQRAALAESTAGAGFGPQSPRDLDTATGNNTVFFNTAPPHNQMNLCNIHFHESAEHRGGEFTTYAGNGDGKGAGTGFLYDGALTEAELAPLGRSIGEGTYGSLEPGDTIELHYVHSTAKITPGPTLGSCLSDNLMNPQLRVETQVFVLVNDDTAADFVTLTAVEEVEGFHQAVNIPTDTGTPIEYDGSTTGPSFNEAGSPLQVSWSVRPEVMKVSITSVEAWLADNIFDETSAHGVRNLVTNPDLISSIGQ